jgi:hypothetical protein
MLKQNENQDNLNEEDVYFNFINSLKSDVTKKEYSIDKIPVSLYTLKAVGIDPGRQFRNIRNPFENESSLPKYR